MKLRPTIVAPLLLTIAISAVLFSAPRKTAADAEAFINRAQKELLDLSVEAGRADWIKSTYITDDTEIIAAKLDERSIAATMRLAKESTEFNRLALMPDLERKLKLLRLSLLLRRPPIRRKAPK